MIVVEMTLREPGRSEAEGAKVRNPDLALVATSLLPMFLYLVTLAYEDLLLLICTFLSPAFMFGVTLAEVPRLKGVSKAFARISSTLSLAGLGLLVTGNLFLPDSPFVSRFVTLYVIVCGLVAVLNLSYVILRRVKRIA